MSLLRDVRFALRTLLRRPGFTAAAAVTLALGIGANTAIFSAVRVALIRPLPYPEPERLAMIWELSPREQPNVVNSGNFLAWQERNRSFDSMAAYAITRANLAGQGAPERVRFGIFTTDLLRTLGVSPLRGRDVEAGDSLPGGQGVVLLSEGYWRRRFGADPEVIGRGLTLNGKAVTVVGVAPRLTLPRSLDESTDVDVWSPLPISERTRTAGGRWLQVVGRLRDGVAREQAGAELETLMAELQRERPDVNARWGVSVAAFHADLVKDVRGALLALMGAVGLLLLIACVNVAGLMLAQALAREREIAVRSALGAGAGRLARQLLTESLVLAALGTGLGLPLGSWMLRGLLALLPGELPLVGEASLDSSVLAFTLAAAVLSAIGFGLVPALRVARPNLVEALKEGGHTSGAGRRRRSLRDALVVAEVAIALVLLVGAGLTVRSFQRLSGVDPGFDPHSALTLQVSLPSASYSDGASQTRYFEQALDQLAALPGAESAGVISWRPLGTGSRTSYWPLDRPTPPPGEELVA
jgi:putative ABC transport system permease protein